jgi:hypothetical protein
MSRHQLWPTYFQTTVFLLGGETCRVAALRSVAEDWEYEKTLADTIKARLNAMRPAVNAKLLRQGLARLFPTDAETNWQKVAALLVKCHRGCRSGAPAGTSQR